MWCPSPTVYSFGETHAAQPPPSSRHWNPDGSDASKVKVASVSDVVPDGPDVIVVCGPVVSTVQLRIAGVGSTLRATSLARTSNVCNPSGTFV
jgi:hypothetical protein